MEPNEYIAEAAKVAGVNINDLNNAVNATIERRIGSAEKANEYEKLVSDRFKKDHWAFAGTLADWEIERMQ